MNITSQEYLDAILRVSTLLGKFEIYKAFIEMKVTLPELTKIIVIDLFTSSLLDYDNFDVNHLQDYFLELNSKGFVEFK